MGPERAIEGEKSFANIVPRSSLFLQGGTAARDDFWVQIPEKVFSCGRVYQTNSNSGDVQLRSGEMVMKVLQSTPDDLADDGIADRGAPCVCKHISPFLLNRRPFRLHRFAGQGPVPRACLEEFSSSWAARGSQMSMESAERPTKGKVQFGGVSAPLASAIGSIPSFFAVNRAQMTDLGHERLQREAEGPVSGWLVPQLERSDFRKSQSLMMRNGLQSR